MSHHVPTAITRLSEPIAARPAIPIRSSKPPTPCFRSSFEIPCSIFDIQSERSTTKLSIFRTRSSRSKPQRAKKDGPSIEQKNPRLHEITTHTNRNHSASGTHCGAPRDSHPIVQTAYTLLPFIIRNSLFDIRYSIRTIYDEAEHLSNQVEPLQPQRASPKKKRLFNRMKSRRINGFQIL